MKTCLRLAVVVSSLGLLACTPQGPKTPAKTKTKSETAEPTKSSEPEPEPQVEPEPEPQELALPKVELQVPKRLPKNLRKGDVPGEHVNPKDGSVLVWVPAGTFTMGSEDGGGNEMPSHPVVITRGFFMGKTEVTRAQYLAFCKATKRKAPAGLTTSDLPVSGVTWFDAWDYCEWAGLRMPTEAEWAYAARGSDERQYPYGPDGWVQEDQRPWNVGETQRGKGGPAPVGSFPHDRSLFGCYDMTGNLHEWTYDRYGIYPGKQVSDPTGMKLGAERVRRGGSYDQKDCRYSTRRDAMPGAASPTTGFRVCRSGTAGGPKLKKPPKSEFTSAGGGGGGGGGAVIRTISRGASVDLKKYLRPKGLTVVEFGGDW